VSSNQTLFKVSCMSCNDIVAGDVHEQLFRRQQRRMVVKATASGWLEPLQVH